MPGLPAPQFRGSPWASARGYGRIPETDQRDPSHLAQMRPGSRGQVMHPERGSLSWAARGSEQSGVTPPATSCRHQPAQSHGVCLWAGCWAVPGGRGQASQGQVCGRPLWAGGPFRAGRMSGPSEADRRCHPAVTSGLARGHREPGTPHGRPHPCTAAPIRFLPIKRPVFLLGKPCQQWSLGRRRGVASGDLGGGWVSLQTRPIELRT